MSINLQPLTLTGASFDLDTQNVQPEDVAWLEFLNESPYTLQVSMGGWSFNIPAWYDFPVQITDAQSRLIINSIQFPVSINPMLFGNLGTAPSTILLATIYGRGEQPVITIPTPLVRQANIGNTIPVSTSATSVANDGNLALTNIVEATVSGDVSSAVKMRNDGSLTLGNSSRPGQLAMASQAPNSGQYSDVIELGNGCQIGIFGSASVDMQLLSNGIIPIKIGSVQIGHFASDGFHLDAGTLAFLVGSISRLKYTYIALVTQTATFFNHGLGVIPDFCILIPNDGVLSIGNFNAYYESSSMTTTQVKLQSNSVGGIPVGLIAVKL